MMESSYPAGRSCQKHWQARLSCTNCLQQPTAAESPNNPEVEIKSCVAGEPENKNPKPDCISPVKAEETVEKKPEPKPEPKPDKKGDAKVDKKADAKAEVKKEGGPCFPDKAGKVEKEEIVMGGKDKGKKKGKPQKPPKEDKNKKVEKKASAKAKESKSKNKAKDKKKPPEKRFEPRKMKNNYPTFTQIGGSVSHNCCSCLDAVGLYFKEFFRFSCSLTTGHPAQDTQFQERICDMLNILATMCRDCYYIVRYVLRLLFVE